MKAVSKSTARTKYAKALTAQQKGVKRGTTRGTSVTSRVSKDVKRKGR